MKTVFNKLYPLMLILLISLSLSILIACNENGEEPDPCDGLTCQNGGELENCECACPANYSGVQCEIFNNICVGVECPIGQSPNPANDCVCE